MSKAFHASAYTFTKTTNISTNSSPEEASTRLSTEDGISVSSKKRRCWSPCAIRAVSAVRLSVRSGIEEGGREGGRGGERER